MSGGKAEAGRGKRYVFRWKEDLIEVRPTIADTPEKSWEIAFSGIYPASYTEAEGKEFCKTYGEVVEVIP